MMHRLPLWQRFVLATAAMAGLIAANSAANTTYFNMVNAPVPGNTVLVYGPTAPSGVGSQEVVESLSLGFDVVINDAPTWSSMTSANFATFRAIILGDPFCASYGMGLLAAAEANRTVWTPAVTGNVIVTGTDEAVHPESSPGARDMGINLKRRGIYFAANNPTKTGAFISLSCYYDYNPIYAPPGPPTNGTGPAGGFVIPLLDQFGAPLFKGHGINGICYNVSHIVATAPGLTGASVGAPPVPLLLDPNLSGWGCSIHEGFTQWPATFSVFAIGKDLGAVYNATDGTKGLPYIIIRGEKVEVVTNITLGPNTATNPVNTTHTVTATISPAPPAGTVVTFTVISGPNVGATGTGTTTAGGVASWTYPDTGGPGTDYIVATWTDAQGVTYTSNVVKKVWRECVTPEFSITGPSTACGTGTYCVTPPPAGATYQWSVSNGTIVGSNTGPCVTINWNSPLGGVVTVIVSGGPNCPKVVKEIGVKPCEEEPKDCCIDVKLSAVANGWALGPGGSANFTPSLSVLAGMGNITKVVATIATTDHTFNKPSCGVPGPVNSYFIGSGFNPNFNATIPLAGSRVLVWKSLPAGGVPLGVAQNFPMTIQFPPPPSSWKCVEYLSFCVRYEFTDVNCKVCEVTVCYGPYKRGGILHWDTPIEVIGGVVGIPLRTRPVISLRDPDGNLITDAEGTVTLSIAPGTGTPGAALQGDTSAPLVNGKANFQDIVISRPGAGYRLRATLKDPDLGEIIEDSNAFNIGLAGQQPIYHTTAPITIDGDITPAEWDGAPVINLNQAIQDLMPGRWTGPADYSGQVKLKWDEKNLYFAAFVADSALSLPKAPEPDDLLGRDGLQIFLGLGEHQHNLAGDSYSDDDYDVRISMDPPADGTNNYTTRISGWGHNIAKPVIGNIRARVSAGGYGLEGALPWSQPEAWQFVPELGHVLGFNLQGRDNDQSVPATDTLMSLSGMPGAETMPNRWTSAVLLGAPPRAGDVNQDGVLDSMDVVLISRMAGGLASSIDPFMPFATADLNGDGKADLKDAAILARMIHGL